MVRPLVRIVRDRLQAQAPWAAVSLALIAMGWLAGWLAEADAQWDDSTEALVGLMHTFVWAAVLLMFVATTCWQGDVNGVSPRLPRWLMVRPVNTTVLATADWGARLLVLLIVAYCASRVADASADMEDFSAGTVVVPAAMVLSAGWLFGGWRRWYAAVLAGVVVIAAWVGWQYLCAHTNSPPHAWQRVGVLYAAPLAACAMLGCAGVWLDRHGVWATRRRLVAVPRLTSSCTAHPSSARSALVAQVWVEWRETVWMLAAIAAGLLGLQVSWLVGLFIPIDQAWDENRALLAANCGLAGAIAGLLRTLHDVRARGTADRTFHLTVPQSSLSFGNARLAAGGLGVGVVLALGGLALGASGTALDRNWMMLWREAVDGREVLSWAVFVAALTWGLYWLAPALAVAFGLFLLAVAGFGATGLQVEFDSEIAFLVLFGSVLMGCAAFLAVTSWLRLRPPARQVLIALLLAPTALAWFLENWPFGRLAGPEDYLLAALLSAGVALPFLTVPATVHWMRHR